MFNSYGRSMWAFKVAKSHGAMGWFHMHLALGHPWNDPGMTSPVDKPEYY